MKEKILEILNNIRPEVDFKNSDNFIDDGFLDSFDMVSLVSNIEKKFNISIAGEDIIPENFENIPSIISMIKKYK